MSLRSLTECDVAILGGGPAGMATVLALLQHNSALQVLVVERSGYDQLRIGETLPPNARPLLEKLAVWPAFTQVDHLRAYGTSAVWGSSTLHTNESFFHLHGHGWHLDRRLFDVMLAQAAIHQGATVSAHTKVLECQPQPDQGWLLTLTTQDDVSWQVKTRFVVDATGRLAWFARQQGAQRIVYDGLIGVAVPFQVAAESVDTHVLVEACELGWWYSALLPDDRLMVMFLSDADLSKQRSLQTPRGWLAQVRQTRYTQGRLQQARPLERPSTYAAHTQRLTHVVGDGWLAVGDAATTFDPLSSQGIFKALQSGIFAAYAISDHLAADSGALAKYEWFVQTEFTAYVATWRNYYYQEQRWPNAPFWQRRHAIKAASPAS
jgi:flavin-dependent dehydrogenase